MPIDRYPLYEFFEWFQEFGFSADVVISQLLVVGVLVALISLFFAFFRRYSRQNAELVERLLLIFVFLIVLLVVARYFDIEIL